ncbi:hypothetical protein CLD20_19665 [Afifella sp. IM 167]|nr:hypothetical protein [Afifella sp. IM 167]
MYVDKNMLNRAEKETDRVVTEQFLGCMNQDVDVFVAPESDLTNLKGDDFKNGADDRALNSLVAQVVYAPGEFDMALHPTSVRLSPITSGFSGSYVFRMDIECPKSGLRTVPAVLKISRDDQALVEAANYKKYVKWILPYRWRVDLLGDGRVKGWSAVCYSFVHSAGHSFNSVTDALLKSDSKAVIQVVDQIFSPSYQTWYSKRLCTESGSTQISAHYSKEYFTTKSLAECGSQFRRHAQRYLGADTSDSGIVHFRELGVTIKEPSTELFAVGRGAFIETICHGDLNSNNIMISGTELTFIDFQSTGRKHVFRDFVTFESSIRLYYSDAPDDGKTCIECEGVISSADVLQERIGDKPDLPEMYRLILRVRQAAMRNFPDEPMSNYLYGATVFSLRLLRITELSPKQYTRLLCQIVSGMSRIKT